MEGSAPHGSAQRTRTRTVPVGGIDFAYRETGDGQGIPLVALTHLGANVDSWDPAVVDLLAFDRGLVLIGYRGVAPLTVGSGTRSKPWPPTRSL